MAETPPGGRGDPKESSPIPELSSKVQSQAEEPSVKKKAPKKREQWSRPLEFILAVVGYAVGLGNLWRFPYLCYKNGGGAFLIPYFLSTFCAGIPIFFMELALGQYLRVGVLGIWKICPILKGVGIAAVVITFWMDVYYIVILSWALLFLLWSFRAELPYESCDHYWNTDRCRTIDEMTRCPENNETVRLCPPRNLPYLPPNESVSSVREFWENNILDLTSGIEVVGGLRWELVGTAFVLWIVCYFSIWKGVKWTGKVLYVSAVAPYFLLFALLIRGITLPGAMEGIKFYLLPDVKKLKTPQVWFDAVSQVFYSYGIGIGSLIALGSYNDYHNNIYRHALITACFNGGTSIFAGFVIFSIIGFMANSQGKPINEVAAAGPGLAFLAFPSAILEMPLSPLWSCLFFLTIILIGIDSQMCMMEGFITACVDEWYVFLRPRKKMFIFVICCIKFLIGITCLTQGGMYVFQLLDYYGASGWCVLWVAFLQCIGVAWCYGAERFLNDITDMLGYRPCLWWKICWLFISPVVCMIVLVCSLVTYTPAMYVNYVYPLWADALGWCISLSSMLCVPVYAIYLIIRTPGPFKKRIKTLVFPELRDEDLRPKESHNPDFQKEAGNHVNVGRITSSPDKQRNSTEMRSRSPRTPEKRKDTFIGKRETNGTKNVDEANFRL